MSGKTVLITGASSGIGKISAIALNKKGYTVYGGARRIDKMKDLIDKGIKTVYLDVTNESSMVQCVEKISRECGGIDILINNAGYGSYGAIEDVSMDEAHHQLEVNLFGLARMVQLVLPYMRKNHFGRIINISSMAGKMTTPYGGWYHAAKFALEGFSDCLRLEVLQFGIDVSIIEPGAIKTNWGIIASQNLIETSKDGAYKKSTQKAAAKLNKLYSGNSISNPSVISDAIVHAVTSKKPKTRYLRGYCAKFSVFSRRILSDRIYDKVIAKIFNM